MDGIGVVGVHAECRINAGMHMSTGKSVACCHAPSSSSSSSSSSSLSGSGCFRLLAGLLAGLGFSHLAFWSVNPALAGLAAALAAGLAPLAGGAARC
jgi:hypothetical protein